MRPPDPYADQRALVHHLAKACIAGQEIFCLVNGLGGPVRITKAFSTNNMVTLEDGEGHRTVVHISAIVGVHMPLDTTWTLGDPENDEPA